MDQLDSAVKSLIAVISRAVESPRRHAIKNFSLEKSEDGICREARVGAVGQDTFGPCILVYKMMLGIMDRRGLQNVILLDLDGESCTCLGRVCLA